MYQNLYSNFLPMLPKVQNKSPIFIKYATLIPNGTILVATKSLVLKLKNLELFSVYHWPTVMKYFKTHSIVDFY